MDFLNTFLLTYRVFTDGETVLEALRRVFYAEVESGMATAPGDSPAGEGGEAAVTSTELRAPSPGPSASRKASGASSVSGKIIFYTTIKYEVFIYMKINFNLRLWFRTK